ncbi:MAG TPA: hypothetical protein VLF93_06805 [Candidatus Saccharimonadales bacterium]|nr:hypothetical protein [Candidatus Saccharimonadales bacterium]
MKNFINKNLTSFIIIISLYLVLQFLSTLPYTNLIITVKNIAGILWIACIILFHLRPRASVIFGMICLLIAFILQQLGLNDLMYSFADAMYLLFIVSIVHHIILIRKK